MIDWTTLSPGYALQTKVTDGELCTSSITGKSYPLIRQECSGATENSTTMVFWYQGTTNLGEFYWINNARRGEICDDKSWLAYDDNHPNCQAACVPALGNECATWTYDFRRVQVT